MRQPSKPFIIVSVVAILLVAAISVGPTFYRLFTDTGIKVEPLSLSQPVPAETDLNGTWDVVKGNGKNSSQVGFTFHEVLPGQRKSTSGSTHKVEGYVDVSGTTLTAAKITVDATSIRTDIEKRDINVRRKLLETDKYPTASFSSTHKVDLSGLPDNGTAARIVIPGKLTLHGQTHDVAPDFTVYRTGKRVYMFTELPVNRLDYGIKTPDFIAAKIAEEGTLDIRLAFEKKKA